jgi:hypothetical protein
VNKGNFQFGSFLVVDIGYFIDSKILFNDDRHVRRRENQIPAASPLPPLFIYWLPIIYLRFLLPIVRVFKKPLNIPLCRKAVSIF